MTTIKTIAASLIEAKLNKYSPKSLNKYKKAWTAHNKK